MTRRRPAAALLALLAALCAAPAAGQGPGPGPGPWLDFPAGCRLGEDCYIQNYVDRDPGPGWADLACSHLGYDGHKGTDIALIDDRAIDAGVPVLAAAAGTVLRVRDGMEDLRFGSEGAPDVSNRECGNGLVIDHGGGWESQYCHMRKGSIAVQPGERVQAGDPLGQIGQSGRAAFPHLHFELRRDGQVVDPMDGRAMGDPCSPAVAAQGRPAGTLWRDPVPYAGTGVIAAGFADRQLSQDELRAESRPMAATSAWAPVLIFWVRSFGLRKGDVQAIEVEAPDGRVIAKSQTPPLEGSKVMSFLFVGIRQPEAGFATGVYTGSYRILRDGDGGPQPVLSATARTEVIGLRGAQPRQAGAASQ